MWRRLWRRRRRRRMPSQSTAAAGDDELSDFDDNHAIDVDNGLNEDEEAEAEAVDEQIGPTLIRVEDGEGGFRHLRLPHPLDEPVLSAPTASTKSALTSDSHSLGLDELLAREFRGRELFSLDSVSESHCRRIVSKKGVVHIGLSHATERHRLYFSDLFNTLLDMRWRYVLTLFCLSFFLSWLLFAVLWYLLLLLHGHLEHTESMPCVLGITGFTSAILFSIETQHTIGYGSRQTTEACWEGVVLQGLQSVVGVMIQACVVGLIFAKVSRPKKRASTLLFSKNAVVCLLDGHLSLCFRVGNMRASHLVEVHTRAILVSKKITEEGHTIPYFQRELQVGTDLAGTEAQLFFIWPTTIVHRIDCSSPFYGMCAHDFVRKRYELIVSLEGIVEPTGMTIQARTSYLPNEILWGYKFSNVLNFTARQAEYRVDYAAFNRLVSVELSRHSARCRLECQVRHHDDCDHRAHHQRGHLQGAKSFSSVIRTPSRGSGNGNVGNGNVGNGNVVQLVIPDKVDLESVEKGCGPNGSNDDDNKDDSNDNDNKDDSNDNDNKDDSNDDDNKDDNNDNDNKDDNNDNKDEP